MDPALFRLLHQAVSNESAVKIVYRSMTRPDGYERTIHPVRFIFAGRRWHARAYDEESGEHRDFNLGRISTVESTGKSDVTPNDKDWDKKIKLHLRAHPHLNAAQVRLICDEMFKGAVGRTVTTRKALLLYTLRELEIAVDVESQKPPDYQIYLHKLE